MGVFDSETCQLLHSFSWHRGKVRTLLVMPKEMEPCICAEVPIVEKDEDQFEVNTDPYKATRRHTQLQPPRPSPGHAAFSFMNNPMFIPNTEPEAAVITSIGNGRKRLMVNELSKADRLKIFDKASVLRRGEGSVSRHGEDVCLLTWRS